jgi:DNA topoisomerase-1
VLNGRYGPYITIDKDNYKIPKGKDPASLTLEDCLKIAASQEKTNQKKAGAKRKKS